MPVVKCIKCDKFFMHTKMDLHCPFCKTFYGDEETVHNKTEEKPANKVEEVTSKKVDGIKIEKKVSTKKADTVKAEKKVFKW